MLPARWTLRGPDGSATFERSEYVADAVTDADVVEPAIRRPLVAFPNGTRTAALPVKIVDGRIYVHATIGSRGVDFLLDTGSSEIAIEAGTAHALGLPFFNKSRETEAQSHDRYDAVIPDMRVGTLSMHDIVVGILPEPLDELPGLKVVGLLGFDFLATLGITIDYEHGTVTATPAGAYAAPKGPYVIPLDVRLSAQVPETTARFDGAVANRVVIDTGADGSFLLFDYFVRRFPERFNRGGAEVALWGIGGAFTARTYQIHEILLGPLRFLNVIGYGIGGGNSYAGNDDGLIGSNFLRLFTLDLDFADGRMYLTPNTTGRRAMGIR